MNSTPGFPTWGPMSILLQNAERVAEEEEGKNPKLDMIHLCYRSFNEVPDH